MGDSVYLGAAEAASRLGISLRTVRRRIADGSLPSARIEAGRLSVELPPRSWNVLRLTGPAPEGPPASI